MNARLAWVLGLALQLMAADPKWIRMASPGFEIYSSAGEGDTRRVLRYFELTSDFFAQMSGTARVRAEPVRVMVFGSKKEYEPYRPNAIAAAFYMGGTGRDYIVLGGTSDDVFPIAVHEYVHLIVQNGGTQLPPWLGEGLAELYSTIRPLGDDVIVGGLIPSRLMALRHEKWVPLATILGAGHDSPYYNEKNKAGSLYNEGWVLAHMLALTRDYSPGFPKLLAAISAARPSQQALEEIYGKPLAQIEKDLQAYVNGNDFRGRVVPVKLRASSGRAAGEALSAFDVKQALLDLTNRPGRENEARKDFEALALEDPKRPEPHVGLGYIAWRLRDEPAMAEHFGKAFELGARSPTFLFDYGRAAAQADPAGAAKALRVLLTDQPNRVDVRIALAGALLVAKDAQGAREALEPVKQVTQGDAERFFRLSAYANLGTQRLTEARAAANRWKEYAEGEIDRLSADEFLSILASHEREAARRVSAREAAGVSAREAARGMALPQPVSGSSTFRANLAAASGVMIEVRCQGDESRLVVEDSGESKVFLMSDTSAVMAAGVTDRNIVDLPCGKLKPVGVTIRHEPPPAQADHAGIARVIEFHAIPERLPEDTSASATQPLTATTGTKPLRPYVEGSFVELDCSSLPPRMVLLVGKVRVKFLMDSVDNMFVYGLPEGKGMEVSCGPLVPASVWVEYDPPSASQRDVRGLARAIHFEPVPGAALKTR